MSRITTTLDTILATRPSAILLDAAGVLYNDSGAIPGVPSAVRFMAQHCPVFLATNNTNSSPQQIAALLAQRDIDIPIERVISSGLIVTLPDRAARIHGKRVYTYGYMRSRFYAELAGGQSVDHPDDAEIIVLASSTGEANDTMFDQVCASLLCDPTRPVWCVNPDFYVNTGTGRVPVIGYYASELVRRTGVTIEWMGKPYSNFSKLIETCLLAENIPISQSIWFFDDNPANVDRLTSDLGISGAVVMDSGLSTGMSVAALDAEFGAGSQLVRIATLCRS